MARKREAWFEYSWPMGYVPCTWEGLVVLVGGVGGFLGLMALTHWLARTMPGSDVVLVPAGLAFLDFLIFFYLVSTHTRTKGQKREEEANHVARRLFR